MKTKSSTWILGVVCILFSSIFIQESYAQLPEDEFHYGFYAGATYSSLSNIQTMLIRSVFDPSTFSTSEPSKIGVTAGFFVYNRFKKSAFAIQPEISYAQFGGKFDYNDIDELNYTIDFKYDYFNVAALTKIYPTGGLFVGLGPQVGFNIGERLTYKSNQPMQGPDLQVERSLQEVIKGNTDFSVIALLGYDFGRGFMFEFRYKQGVSDAVQTLSNGFYFIENKNTSKAFLGSLVYAIPFY